MLNYDDLKWIKHFVIIAGTILIIWSIAIVRNYQDNSFSSPNIYYPLRLSLTIVIYWIGFKGLLRSRILEDRIVLRENIKKEIPSNKMKMILDLSGSKFNYKIDLKSQKQENLFKKINDYVKEQKKYLDPYIGLESLSNEVKISTGHLSHLVNTYSNCNFSDYINGLRIEQVKNIITDPEYLNYTIVAIGLESGFNSKSTFYTAFKKFTNLSPRQFKQQLVGS